MDGDGSGQATGARHDAAGVVDVVHDQVHAVGEGHLRARRERERRHLLLRPPFAFKVAVHLGAFGGGEDIGEHDVFAEAETALLVVAAFGSKGVDRDVRRTRSIDVRLIRGVA